MADKWAGLCGYSGPDREQAYCETTPRHSYGYPQWRYLLNWQNKDNGLTFSNRFMCGKVNTPPFSPKFVSFVNVSSHVTTFHATLGAMDSAGTTRLSCGNGQYGNVGACIAASYDFAIVQPSKPNAFNTSGNEYAKLMTTQCAARNMKPVCDFGAQCANDKNALFLGQTSRLSMSMSKQSGKAVPQGFDAIKDKWTGLCAYAGLDTGAQAYCNQPDGNSRLLGVADSKNPGFVCGRRHPLSVVFTATLAARDTKVATRYTFMTLKTAATKGSYGAIMAAECSGYGMKPVCAGPSHCDAKSLSIGSSGLLSNPKDRRTPSKMPAGFEAISHYWNGLCSYATGKTTALCNVPLWGSSWRSAAQTPTFVCGRVEEVVAFTGLLRARGAKAGAAYRFMTASVPR